MVTKNILICMQQMDIGGVETVVLNHIKSLRKKNYNITVVGTFGVYTEIYKNLGANCINFNFTLKKYYEKNDSNTIAEAIAKNKIHEVHIHSTECVPYILPVCVDNNIPYVGYIHGGTKEVYEWYLNNYYIFDMYLHLYFENAHKLITITNKAKENILSLFKINNGNKFLIIPNSVCFDELPVCEKSKNKNRILLLSRLSREKENSIINSINFFKAYQNENKNAKLFILGTGNCENDIKNYVARNNLQESIVFLGKSTNVYKEIEKCDIVIGMGRCILEALAMKKIAIISGYKYITDMVTIDNIAEISEENFTDRYTINNKFSETLNKLANISYEQINKIVTENYDFCYRNFNSDYNLYCIDEIIKTYYLACKIGKTIELSNIFAKHYESIIKDKETKLEEIYQTNIYLKEQIAKLPENQLKTENVTVSDESLQNIYDENNKLKEEIERVYNSRTWKLRTKILKFFNKINRNTLKKSNM